MNEAAGQPSDRDATLISGDSMIGDIVGLGRLGPGKRLGRYIVLDRIGAGEHGIVYAAHDPELDRKVAIKLLRPRIGEALVCEAKRAAALTHPNLVKLHEIGNVHEVVFVVMDHISGQRLREWIATGPKPWKLVVEILRKTGAGLAAAHRAALVHANFTPNNVLLDAELEPRVIDLGLAGAALASDQASVKLRLPRRPEESSSSSSSSSSADALVALLTPADQRHGCWAYIAPERYAGELADARSDQFAYCVTLYEALYGERPFEARSIQAVLQAVREGRVKRPPARARVPRWLRRIVLRGLANDPAQRWPSMDALLDALDRNLERRSQRIVASVAFAIAALTASLAATRSAKPLTPAPTMDCTIQDADAAFESAWTAERRTRLEQRIAEVGRPWAKPLSASLLPRIDAWAEAWQAEWIDACAATRVRADQPEAVLDRRMHCLDRQRRQLDAYTGALLGADAADLADALSGVEALDQPDACRLASAPLPDDPEHRERVVEVAAGLDQARALGLAGRHDQALAKLRSLSAPLRDASWSSLDAEHELLEARATIAASPRFDLEEITSTALPRALGDALAAGDDRLAAEIALELAALSEPATPWLDLAQGLAQRTGQPKLRAAAWLARARVEAHPSLVSDHARPLLVELCDEDSVQLAEADHILARAALTVGKFDEADAALERARDRWVRLGGDNHPRSLDLLETAAELALARGRLRAAESSFGELVARTEHVEIQPTPVLARRLLGLAKAQTRQGEFMFARRSLARAVALYESPALADHPSRVGALAALALFEADRGELEAGLVHAEAAVDAASEYGVSPEHWAAARHALGRVQLLRGKLDAADSNLRAALERVESAQVLYDLHRLAVARGERESAEALLVTAERSLLWDYGGTPDPWQFVQLAVARWEFCGCDGCDHDDIDQYAVAREDFAQLQNPDPALAWDFKQVLAQLDS